MGLLETLHGARVAFERKEWLAAYDGLAAVGVDLAAADYADLAAAAFLVGRHDDCIHAFGRAHHAFREAGETERAIWCAYHLANVLADRGELAVAGGWAARAERLAAELPAGSVARGFVEFVHGMLSVFGGDVPTARARTARAVDIGQHSDDPELLSLALMGLGRSEIYAGQFADGLGCLDEAMVGVLNGDVPPLSAGHVYCSSIEACQEISDFGRMGEWTEALSRWCASQPELVAFTGQCAIHRGQLMRVHGALHDAASEFRDAAQRYQADERPRSAGFAHAGAAEALIRLGDLVGASDALGYARRAGYDPHPEEALLAVKRGHVDEAASTAARMLDKPMNPIRRSRLLPPVTEVLLAVADRERAADATAELAGLAETIGTPALVAFAERFQGELALADGDDARAEVTLRSALAMFARLDCRYEVAEVRHELAVALARLGDHALAERERAVADGELARLGAPATRAIRPGGLSERECEVLRHVAAGESNRDIARALQLSEKTVARHLSNIFSKLDVGSRTAAAAYAYEHGITVSPGP